MADIFVPRPSEPLGADTDAYGVTWVTVQHPGLGAEHRIPVDALEGFRESGWELIPEAEYSNSKPAAVDNDDTSKE